MNTKNIHMNAISNPFCANKHSKSSDEKQDQYRKFWLTVHRGLHDASIANDFKVAARNFCMHLQHLAKLVSSVLRS